MWGRNVSGQLGVGDNNDRHEPVEVRELDYKDGGAVAQVALGGAFTLALLRESGELTAIPSTGSDRLVLNPIRVHLVCRIADEFQHQGIKPVRGHRPAT